MASIIRVENLGRKYILRHQAGGGRRRYAALRDVLARKFKNLLKPRADGARTR